MMNIKYLLLIFTLSACAVSNPLQHANALAQNASMMQARVQAGRFALNTYSRLADKNKPIHVYIEGDGLAWRNTREPSPDPTPRQALALQLAILDKAENVVYIARPCQFYSENCDASDWTNKRFSEEVVVGMNQALDYFVAKTHQQQVHLIGYSGGGAIAVLLAARRSDIASLRTVAGNLDHQTVNALSHVSIMPESLNPIDFAQEIREIPQLHFVGEHDTRIPAVIAQAFVKAQHTACAATVTVASTTHSTGWQTQWPALLQKAPSCDLNKP